MVTLPDSSKALGKLDWSKKQDYSVNNVPYFEVPFIFDKAGENVPTGSTGAYTRFHIVMRTVRDRF